MSGYRASVVLARFRVQRAAAPALMPSKLQSLASAPTAWIALAVALVMNAANLLEPVTVDDVCHHYYAAQVLREPLNPFGFEALWHQKPVPAWTIMVAPVHSFYWAPGLWLFGDWIPGWHLWMLPVQWLLCGSLLSLLRRWVGRGAVPLLCAIVLGPAILPGINLMLDVPMLSLSMAALALVMRASDRHSAALAIAAGVLWGLSFQTKYSAMCLFGPWFLLALLRPRGREFVIGFAAAVGTALSIEGLMALSHEGGGSYFIQQLSYTQDRVWSHLFKGMFQHVGVLAIPAVLMTLQGWTRGLRWPLLATAFYAACFAVVGIWPDDGSRTLADGAPDSIAYVLMSSVTWTVLGALLLTLLRGGLPFVLRRRMPRGRRRRLFLAAWVVSEIAGSFVVSPFPAARRVMVVAIALTVAAGWYCSRRTRCQSSGGGGGGWGLAAAVSLTLGFGIQSLDYIEADAWVEAAAEVADYAAKRDPAAEIYFVGGWGFEFYAPRAGLLPLLEQRVQLQPGDLVAVGSIDGIESAWFEPDPRLPQIDEMWFGSDAVPFSTQFSYYSGQRPIDGQVGPRYRVRILRASEALHTSELRTIPNEWKSRGPQ